MIRLAPARLAAHTAHRVGGEVPLMVVVHREADLGEAARAVSAVAPSWRALGAGTRVLARDEGHTFAVLRLGHGFSRISREERVVEVGAAAPVPALYAAAARWGLGGLPPWSAVGSFGASLALDPWGEVVESVRFLYRGKEREGTLEEARASRLILGARLRLSPADSGALTRKLSARLAQGGFSAWYPWSRELRHQLTRVEVPGVRVYAVWVPPTAPEMLVNLGGATALELSAVHRSIQERVKKLRGEELGSSAHWWGQSPGGGLR